MERRGRGVTSSGSCRMNGDAVHHDWITIGSRLGCGWIAPAGEGSTGCASVRTRYLAVPLLMIKRISNRTWLLAPSVTLCLEYRTCRKGPGLSTRLGKEPERRIRMALAAPCDMTRDYGLVTVAGDFVGGVRMGIDRLQILRVHGRVG